MYNITFSNVGTADCTGGGVRVSDKVDSQLSYLDEKHSENVSPDNNGDENAVYNKYTQTLKWNAHTLNPGEKGWVSWTGKVKQPQKMCMGTTIKNIAQITSWEYNHFNTWVKSNEVKTSVGMDCDMPTPGPTCGEHDHDE